MILLMNGWIWTKRHVLFVFSLISFLFHMNVKKIGAIRCHDKAWSCLLAYVLVMLVELKHPWTTLELTLQ